MMGYFRKFSSILSPCEADKKIASLKRPKYMFWLSCCLLFAMLSPFVYGALLILLQNYNQEWLTALIGWTDQGLDEWVEALAPAVQQTSVHLASLQYGGFIPSIRHTYSVGLLIFVLSGVSLFFLIGISTFASSFWAKRVAVLQLRKNYGYSFFLWTFVALLLGLGALYSACCRDMVEVALEGGRTMRIFGDYLPDSLYILILMFWVGGGIFTGGGFFMAGTGIKAHMLRRYRRMRRAKREQHAAADNFSTFHTD